MSHISILIPTFNRPQFLELVICNIKLQSYDHSLLEVVIYDDGDVPFIKGCDKEDEIRTFLYPITFKYVRDTRDSSKVRFNIGQKRNYLIENLASYDILVFMDDDDVYLPNYIEKSYKTLVNKNAGLVGSNQMILSFPYYNYETFSIDCFENLYLIHECTMMMTRQWFMSSPKFGLGKVGEGVHMIKGNEKYVHKTNITDCLIQMCWSGNTAEKNIFRVDERRSSVKLPFLYQQLFDNILKIKSTENFDFYLLHDNVYCDRRHNDQLKCFHGNLRVMTFDRINLKTHLIVMKNALRDVRVNDEGVFIIGDGVILTDKNDWDERGLRYIIKNIPEEIDCVNFLNSRDSIHNFIINTDNKFSECYYIKKRGIEKALVGGMVYIADYTKPTFTKLE